MRRNPPSHGLRWVTARKDAPPPILQSLFPTMPNSFTGIALKPAPAEAGVDTHGLSPGSRQTAKSLFSNSLPANWLSSSREHSPYHRAFSRPNELLTLWTSEMMLARRGWWISSVPLLPKLPGGRNGRSTRGFGRNGFLFPSERWHDGYDASHYRE